MLDDVKLIERGVVRTAQPSCIARLFVGMSPVEMAAFFNEVHKQSSNFRTGSLKAQLGYIQKGDAIKSAGRLVMDDIGKHALELGDNDDC